MPNLTSWLLHVMANILTFETSSSGVFVGIAQSAMTAVALVLVLMFAVRCSQAVELGQSPQVGGYLHIGLKLGLCLGVLAAWNIPAPGLGSPIGTWIPNMGIKLAQLIGWDGAQGFATNLASWSGLEMPGAGFSVGVLMWILAQLILIITTVLMAIVLVGPFVIVGLLVIIGPIFVVMWPVPELTVYARGYVRCLVTYSLVPVIVAAAFRVITQIVMPSVGQLGGVVTSVEGALPQAFLLCLSLLATIWVMVTCVSVANHVTSGSSGAGLGWLTAGVAAAKSML